MAALRTTSTTTRPDAGRSKPSAAAPQRPPVLPQRPDDVRLRARRNPRLIVIGILCACLGSLGMAWAWSTAQDSRTVVVVAHSVSRGQQIGPGDLTTTTLGAGAGLATLSSERADELIGRYALVDMPAGSLVGPDSIGDRVVPQGAAHVGLRLQAGRLPNRPLPSGTPVLLVEVPGPSDQQTAPGIEVEAVVVSAPQALADGQTWVVDVQVDDASAATVAALAAVDRLALVRLADG
ncbi:SAF domain-containing protein [Brooklawnia cerclae]|uniref:SAF domain-containing protein n=1 Tax=Brooklawnia cerclae TaxID=349934 RepID=UPI00141DC23A|nr:SAF domain-containing protein [Brooklawnia cerclae]